MVHIVFADMPPSLMGYIGGSVIYVLRNDKSLTKVFCYMGYKGIIVPPFTVPRIKITCRSPDGIK